MSVFFTNLNNQLRRILDEIQHESEEPDAAVHLVADHPGLDGFQWKVLWVAASGFFTTSYSIFAVNVIAPALAFVYPQCQYNTASLSLIIDITTLAGTMVGALLFGFLADRHGRKAIYGLELSIVIVATIGMTTASSGFTASRNVLDASPGDAFGVEPSQRNSSMNPYGWIGFWRAMLGVGLGAEYPLSAIIAAEWSSTKTRGRMMAAVFLMQSLGQIAASGLALAILTRYSRHMGPSADSDTTAIAVDRFWRLVIVRRLIPETPHYLAEKGRVPEAVEAARSVYAPAADIRATGRDTANSFQTTSHALAREPNLGRTSWYARTREYFRQLNDPKTISRDWLSHSETINKAAMTCAGGWRTDLAHQDWTIFQLLREDCVRNIATVSSGALPGSIIILFAIDYVPRVTWMGWMFATLAGLFAINGATFFVAYESDKHALTIVLVVLSNIIFNLGPNTMTFIIPAELFRTKYRGTLYGLSTAVGKFGAITIVLILDLALLGGQSQYKQRFGAMLLGFCPAMLLGAVMTWVWIPDVQFPRGQGVVPCDGNTSNDEESHTEVEETFRQRLKLPNRPLADIARRPGNGHVIGLRLNMKRFLRIGEDRSKDLEMSAIAENHRRASTPFSQLNLHEHGSESIQNRTRPEGVDGRDPLGATQTSM
ncbi:major facilitator superfamily domain-containing protein [Xylariaceae sp. FL0804]|nr:major facilitator superfamily domain-containing protein [Xylariaceae sp. FL0804]